MRLATPFGFVSSLAAEDAAVTAASSPGSFGLLGLRESGLLPEENRLLLLPVLFSVETPGGAFILPPCCCCCSVVALKKSAVLLPLPPSLTLPAIFRYTLASIVLTEHTNWILKNFAKCTFYFATTYTAGNTKCTRVYRKHCTQCVVMRYLMLVVLET